MSPPRMGPSRSAWNKVSVLAGLCGRRIDPLRGCEVEGGPTPIEVLGPPTRSRRSATCVPEVAAHKRHLRLCMRVRVICACV